MRTKRSWRTRSRALVVTVLVVVAVWAGACGTSEQQAGEVGSEVRPGGTVVYASVQRITGFNQLNARSASLTLSNVMRRVWPSAFNLDANGERVLNRDLLESAELTSADPQTVVYRLNPRAVWSDGDPIDAQEFVYLWRTAYTEGATDIDGSEIAATTSGPRGAIDSVTPSDDGRTVTVVFARSYPDWRSLFSFLVPVHVAERVGWNKGFDTFDPAVVVSGGPFRIAGHRPDQDLTLVRNERYWGPQATLDSIVIRFVADGNQLLSAIKNRELDLALLLNPTVDAVIEARAVPGLTTLVHQQERYTRLYFNFRNPLLAIPEVRRGIALAVDRPAVLARSTRPLDPAKAKIANSFLYAPVEPGYRDTSAGRYDRSDPIAATALLEGAGFRRGADGIYQRGPDRLSLRLPGGGAVAQVIQAQVRDAGIEIRIDAPIDTPASGDFDVVVNSRPTGLTEIAPQFSTGGGFNYGRYSNPSVDDLIRQADSELDDTRRHALHLRIDEILWQDLPTLPLEQVLGVVVHRDALANVVPQAGGGLFWNAEKWALRSKR